MHKLKLDKSANPVSKANMKRMSGNPGLVSRARLRLSWMIVNGLSNLRSAETLDWRSAMQLEFAERLLGRVFEGYR
jgi:hypothetical protein